ncbi:MAG: PQQ-dependent sugar dehydrogenase [Pseudomonadota bacterium]
MSKLNVIAFFPVFVLASCSDSDQAPAPPPSNTPPAFTSAASANTAEGSSGSFYTASANDADGDPLTFSVSGGGDAVFFSITPAGALSFVEPPEFERPRDTDRNNIYRLTISVSDGAAAQTLAVDVTVTDEPEPYRLTRVAAGLAAPLFLQGRPGEGDVFVTERAGVIRLLNPQSGVVDPTPFLDISSSVGVAGEGGLIGFAPAPDYAASGIIYVHVTNLGGDSEIRRYTRSATDPDTADPASEEIVLTVAQPADNHNGGWIGFGADNLLYIALGDGGGGGDPFDNGQDIDTLLGSVLRIDPSGDDFPGDASRNYAIPGDNPFVGVAGADEILAIGLRNPYRAGFDRATGDLYLGDVGQSDIEEVSLIENADLSGRNFGWPAREGTQMEQGPDDPSFTAPVIEYAHGGGPREGRSITGGYAYRGPIAALSGRYFFADFITGNVWSVPVDEISQGETIPSSDFILETDALAPDAGSLSSIVSFGEDNAGNLFILTIGGDVFQIVPA